MRNILKPLSALFSLPLLCIISVAQVTEKAIIENPGGNTYVQVETGPFTPISQPTGALFVVKDETGEEQRIQITNQISDMESFRRFRFYFPPEHPFDPKESYEVVLTLQVKEADGTVRTILRTISVSSKLTMRLVRSGVPCDKGLAVSIRSNVDDFNWSPTKDWLDTFKSNPSGLATLSIHVVDADDDWNTYDVKTFFYSIVPQAKRLTICLLTTKPMPEEDFIAEVTFNGTNRPPEIKPTLKSKKLAGFSAGESPTDGEVKAPGDRPLERNLDLGLTLTSSVKNEETPATSTTPATVTRERTTRGVFDVRFVPVMDVLHRIIDDNVWIGFFTPFFLNANVSTGKIDTDTLSLNRVLFGFEGEMRYRQVRYTRFGPKPEDVNIEKIATHRLIYGLTHASDRDFKQDEFTGKLEYQPIIWKLNNPINLNYRINPDNNEKVKGTFGYSFIPTFGFEIGRTYRRRNPAPDIKPSDTVRRFYIGLDASLDITKRFSFTVKDVFYIRGETPDDRFKNYFKGGVVAPMGRVFGSAVQSLFLTFERGDLAPFASPSVNALKVGYRIQANFCEPYCR